MITTQIQPDNLHKALPHIPSTGEGILLYSASFMMTKCYQLLEPSDQPGQQTVHMRFTAKQPGVSQSCQAGILHSLQGVPWQSLHNRYGLKLTKSLIVNTLKASLETLIHTQTWETC